MEPFECKPKEREKQQENSTRVFLLYQIQEGKWNHKEKRMDKSNSKARDEKIWVGVLLPTANPPIRCIVVNEKHKVGEQPASLYRAEYI